MKNLAAFIIFLSFALSTVGQNYLTKSGHIWFFSSAPLEDIEAHNYQVTSIINTNTGEMVFKVLMRGFQFEKSLMQEHFNQKYIESDKYPEATFKGKIINLDEVNFNKDGSYEVKVKGELTIHGVTQEITADGKIEVKAGKIASSSLFKVAVADYKISIPAGVKDNIAKIVDVHVDMNYEPLK